VDFLLGRITRPHADLDLVVWQRHRRRIQRALVADGFRLERELPVQTDLVQDAVDVTFVFLERASDGSIVGHGMPEWVWRTDALPPARHCLGGICARVVAPIQMLDDQEGYEAATGRPPRPKDAQTQRRLRDIVRRTRARQSECGAPTCAAAPGGPRRWKRDRARPRG